ncbi:HEAT repeat domain-containing protein [Candidatus Nitronereus thalassa]|uniref:HEAT repeat domain-containing protein n=1 Tax=Candidatus Nitronereus thalassa TaxID=3020898 RepID=A0ABU3KBU2_9BACT|nr:HEAT repeat domain-containing protein [Candidatus Nitronereus thalassa]MDT7043890.1 HEAT repeat domain-containing protein [Candidatus Nitronereus thalassa]
MSSQSFSHIVTALLITLAVGLLSPTFIQAQAQQELKKTYTPEEKDNLKAIHTILLGGKVTTWLDYEYPIYDPVSNLKGRLEEVGFHIVFDPEEPHDAILFLEYTETPSGTFRALEQGTAVTFNTTVYHPKVGIIASNHFEAEPSEVPIGGLYWDTIGNLEGDPLFFFQAQILKAWLTNQTDAGTVLMKMVRRPYTDTNFEQPYEQPGPAFVRRVARINAIRAIGALEDPQAQKTLWELTKVATPEERSVAVQVLGSIGNASFVPKLSLLAERDLDLNVQNAAQEAIRNIETGQ